MAKYVIIIFIVVVSQESILAQKTGSIIENGYYFIPDQRPIPSISDSTLEKELNEVVLKKKYNRRSFYLSITVFINQDGSLDNLEVTKCFDYPACPSPLRDKQLFSDLKGIIGKITWKPISYNEEKVSCFEIIQIYVENGIISLIKE